MTLTELRYLVALAQTQHFGKAAELCCVSQPTLSVAINKLENELKLPLFERQRKQVWLTDKGQEIVAQAQRVLEEADKIHLLANAAKSQCESPLKLGAIYTVAPYLFPTLIPALKKTAPQMSLIIQEDYTENLTKQLQSGQLDAALISLPFSEPGIVCKTLYKETFVIVLPKDHKLAKEKVIKPAQLAKEPMLLLGEGHCFRDQVLKACPKCYQPDGVQPLAEGSSLETLRHMVASGIGLTILPSSATSIQYYKGTLTTKAFSGTPPTRQVAIAWRASFPRPKAIEAVLQALSASQLNGVCLAPQLC